MNDSHHSSFSFLPGFLASSEVFPAIYPTAHSVPNVSDAASLSKVSSVVDRVLSRCIPGGTRCGAPTCDGQAFVVDGGEDVAFHGGEINGQRDALK